MNKAHWIWYNGDFELYHSIKLHSRRTEYGVQYPAFWHLDTPYVNVRLLKSFECPEEFTFKAVTTDNVIGRAQLDGKFLPLNKDITAGAGSHLLILDLTCVEGFPCAFIDSKYLVTDETWSCGHKTGVAIPVGDRPEYFSPDDDPRIFPFEYEIKKPRSRWKVGGGTLYDYGEETFCRITVEGADPDEEMILSYGESREEALDVDEALVTERLSGRESYVIDAHAFRFLYAVSKSKIKITAEYEYLPLEDNAFFECSNRSIKKIWDTCAYTFHLNSREFYLDGIKRDRWVWSGDAYQSYMANRYLYFDPEITKRTIIALLGKAPFEQHVNTINDYSLYLIMGAHEYYEATGDEKFVKTFFDRIRALYGFIEGRLDENGYMCERDGDWVFIDWSDMDRSAPLAAEQILLWRTHGVMAELNSICGHEEEKEACLKKADALKKKIMRDFWNSEKGAFVDCLGSEHITRHPNIFAVLYDFVSDKNARRIVRNVLNNDEVTQITTPYFEFFELCARCKMGDVKFAQKKISSYWGGMVKLGATSIWEQFDPQKTGTQHYEMYGNKYGCSLCHAWGSGPVYLLGRYCLGVYSTSVGYESFTVEPKLGVYKFISGKVPLPNGDYVTVNADKNSAKVYSTKEGGKLIFGKKEYEIKAGEELVVEI